MKFSSIQAWQSRFRILSGWKIQCIKSKKYQGQVTINPKFESAIIYAWESDSEAPSDFLLHELIHIALYALKRIPKSLRYDAEEWLTQDLCAIVCEQVEIAKKDKTK